MAIPKGLVSRSVELLKLAAKVGSEELLSNNVATKQIEQAKTLVDSLGRLKGAAMKVGQLLSMDFSDLFPPEVRQVLEQLQGSSPHFMSEKEVRSILKTELGERYGEIKNLSVCPIAAASIGQVHSAEWQGKEIVIKLQYPGVADSIESDIVLLKGVVQSLLVMARKKMDLDPLFNELKEVFRKETDYALELKSLKEYKSNIEKYPAYRCPVVYEELSTQKILCMSFEKGISLREWIKSTPSQERREALGKKVLDLYSIEFFENSFVQSDPNPANFLIDENDCIILLDFGAMKSFEKSFVTNYISLMKSVNKKDMPAAIFQSLKMGFIDERENDKVKELFFKMLRSSLCAFDQDKQPFDFRDKDYFERTKTSSHEFGRYAEFSPPPFELIFLHRKLVGVFGILRDLGLKIDLASYWQRATNLV